MSNEGSEARQARLEIEYRGHMWRLSEPYVTSDGYRLASGTLLYENGEVVVDSDGFPVTHSFFLGRVIP